MEFDPPVARRLRDEWTHLRTLWLELPTHPSVLDAVEPFGKSGLLLRYAALDWNHRPLEILGRRSERERARAVKRLTMWGAQLSHAYGVLSHDVPKAEIGHLLCPFVKLDLEGHVRIGFLPASPSIRATNRYMPPEAKAQWPRCDPRGLVYLVGGLLSGLWVRDDSTETAKLTSIIDRCLDPDPGRRYQSLDDLRTALIDSGQVHDSTAVRGWNELHAWDLTEAGVGFLAIDKLPKALRLFEEALTLDPSSRVADNGRDIVLYRLGKALVPFRPRPAVVRAPDPEAVVHAPAPEATPWVEWSDSEPLTIRLESERAFAEALAIYRSVRLDDTNRASVLTAKARCHLMLGEAGHAIDYAGRALLADPARTEAMAIKVSGFLLAKHHHDALRHADELLVATPDEASAHYARGRCLLGLGRLVEAKESFDRASVLRPDLLQAMLLRREVDRCLKNVRDSVGTQPAVALDVPEYLAELRPILAGGHIEDAMLVLQRPEHEGDAVAQLLLARCLAVASRFEQALAIYDRAASLGDEVRHEALVGKAAALVDLDRVHEALCLLDRLCAERPDDPDSIEGRARALALAGRTAEAEAEYQRFIVLTGDRANLRVRSTR